MCDVLSQPPCEAVSWNDICNFRVGPYNRQPPCEAVSWNLLQSQPSNQTCVSLLVRLWVEIPCTNPKQMVLSSASLWGCELKCDTSDYKTSKVKSASLWGCELKCVRWRHHCNRKYVSLLVRLWVEILGQRRGKKVQSVSLLVRLWVEILEHRRWYRGQSSQPPCEAVSWNTDVISTFFSRLSSASLWGCELKFLQLFCSSSSHRSASLWGCELK